MFIMLLLSLLLSLVVVVVAVVVVVVVVGIRGQRLGIHHGGVQWEGGAVVV